MRKLTKKALSLVLCVMLVATVFSGVFSTSAADVINPAPLNLDLADGLAHWMDWGTEEAPKAVVENGALKATDNYTNWHELKTEKFNVPNAKGGEVVRFSFNVKFDDATILEHASYNKIVNGEYGNHVLKVYLKRYEAGTTSAVETKEKVVYFNEGGPVISGPITVVNPTDSFRIFITSSNSCKKTWEITDIAFLVRDDSATAWESTAAFGSHGGAGYSYFAYTDGAVPTAKASADGSIGGTEAEGLTYKMFINDNTIPSEFLATLDVPQNLDFASGLKYWGSTLSQKKGAVKGTNTASEVESVENGVVTLKQKTRNQQGIITQKFKLDNLVAGDKIRVVMVYKTVESETATVNDAFVKIRAYKTAKSQRGGFPYGWSNPGEVDNVTGTKSYTDANIKLPLDATGYSVISRSITVDDTYENGTGVFDVMVGYGDNAPKVTNEETGEEVTDYSTIAQLQIKQVYIFKETADDADNYIYIPTGEKYSKKYLMPYGGTEADGIPAINYSALTHVLVGKDGDTYYVDHIEKYGINEGLKNADFSKGFQNWSPFRYYSNIAASARLSGIASVDNGVVTIKGREFYDDGVTAFTSEGLGLASQAFKIPGLEAGDRLIMTIDVSSGSFIRGALGEYKTVEDGGIYKRQSEAMANPIEGLKNIPYELWVTPELTVTDPEGYFMVTIRNKSVTSDVSFKNVRIYKVTEDNNLIDVTTGCTEDSQVVNANGGTAENGMLVARDYDKKNYYNTDIVTTDILNGDFTDGLKYWKLGNARRGSLSYVAEVVDGAINITAATSSNNEQTSIKTNKLNLDAVAGNLATFTADVTKHGAGVYLRIYEDGAQIAKKGIWTAGKLEIADIEIKEGSLYEIELYVEVAVNGSQNGKVSIVDNVAILVKDGGGLEDAPMIKVDGSLVEGDKYGDANYDGKVDLLDIVRMKENLTEGTALFFAAVDANNNGELDADDFVDVINWVINAKK